VAADGDSHVDEKSRQKKKFGKKGQFEAKAHRKESRFGNDAGKSNCRGDVSRGRRRWMHETWFFPPTKLTSENDSVDRRRPAAHWCCGTV
jgi:hypothetical protein